MMSRALCLALGVQALLLLLMAPLLMGGGARTPAIILAAGLGLVAWNVALVVALYASLRWYAATLPPARSREPRHAWHCAMRELLALWAAFVVIQPFERWWMGKETVGPSATGRSPLLLVHGYLCNRGLWWWLRRQLRARQFAVATVNLEPPLADLDELVARLRERVEALLQETGAHRIVLVTHSMGGLVARAYVQRHGADRIARMITIAAPHHGTQIARLGWGRNARQMRPGSDWLRRLNAQAPPPIPVQTIWSRDDEILAPPDTGRLLGAREAIFDGLGHMAMAFSPRVLACLEAELALP